MKVLSSTLFQDNKPITPELEPALLFAELNQPAIRGHVDSVESDKQRISGSQNKARANTQTAEKKKKNAFITLAVIVAVGVVVLAVGLSQPEGEGAAVIGGIVAVIGVIVGLTQSSNAKKEIEKQQKILQGLQRELEEVNKRPLPKTVTKLGKLHYAARVVPFETGHLVLDSSGFMPKAEFSYPEIEDGAARISNVYADFTQLPDELPALLASDPEHQGASPRLVGLEAEIQGILDQTNQLFSDTTDMVVNLPVYSNQSNFVRSLQSTVSMLQESDTHLVSLQKEQPGLDDILESLAATREQAVAAQAAGAGGLEVLMAEMVEKIDGYLGTMKTKRDFSLNSILSKDLGELKHLSDFPLTRFYCPKCHEAAQWKRLNLSVQPQMLLVAPESEVSTLPLGDQLIQLRRSIDTLKRYLATFRNVEPVTEGGSATMEGQISAVEAKIAELESTLEHLLEKEINKPLEEHGEVLKRNAVLKYNLSSRKWTCQLCDSEFTTDQAQLGRLLKIKDDLMLPIWDSLWLEKKDEKDRVIREREQERRRNNQNEMNQLRNTAQVFTEEWRAIRTSMEEIGVQSEKAKLQLDMMFKYYAQQGMISSGTEQHLRALMQQGGRAMGADGLLAIANQLERELENEPDKVSLKRGALVDYSLEIRNLGKYFTPTSEAPPLEE